MGYATQVTAIRPGAWQLERDPVPYQQDRRHRGEGPGRFAAALDQNLAMRDGPGRAWTEAPLTSGSLHPSLLGMTDAALAPATPQTRAAALRIYRS